MKVFDEEKFMECFLSYDDTYFTEFLERTGFCTEKEGVDEDVSSLCDVFISFMRNKNPDEIQISEEEMLTLADNLDEITNLVQNYGISSAFFIRNYRMVKSNAKKRRVL